MECDGEKRRKRILKVTPFVKLLSGFKLNNNMKNGLQEFNDLLRASNKTTKITLLGSAR